MGLGELITELRNLDEVTLLEILGVTSDDLVDAFLDRIQEDQIKLTRYMIDEQN